MSEETAEADMSSGHSTATDPRGTIASGQPPDSWYPTGAPSARTAADLTDEERAYHRKIYGVTHRERYGQPSGVCVTYCLTPGQRRRGVRCPSCFQENEIRPMDGSEIEPGPTRAERFAAWVGGWVAAFCEAVLYPFRVGRAHTEALVRDILQQAMEAGLSAEIDGMTDILTVLEGIEGELRGIRNALKEGS